MNKTIDTIFAFTCIDKQGQEGIIGTKDKEGNWLPFVGADMKRLEDLMPSAITICRKLKLPCYLKTFKMVDQITLV